MAQRTQRGPIFAGTNSKKAFFQTGKISGDVFNHDPKSFNRLQRVKVKSHYVVARSLVRLQNIGEAMVGRKIKEIEELQAAPIPKSAGLRKARKELIEQKFRELNVIRARRNFLLDHYLKEQATLASKDIDFPLLLNRVAFIRKLKLLLNGPLALKESPHTLVFFDMDTLKLINERFYEIPGGHKYLLSFSRALAKTSPKGDGFAAHLYGDEFLLYTPWDPTVTYDFLVTTFEEARIRELKKWRYYETAVAEKIPLNYSAGIVGLGQHINVEKAVDFAQRKCKIAKAKSREENTFEMAQYRRK